MEGTCALGCTGALDVEGARWAIVRKRRDESNGTLREDGADEIARFVGHPLRSRESDRLASSQEVDDEARTPVTKRRYIFR